MYILRIEKQGGGKLMLMPFEIVCICAWLWYFFQKRVIMQLIHIYINCTCSDECLEQFFVYFPTLLRMLMNYWGGVHYQFDRNSISVILTHQHIGSVTIC